jgi:F-type H+-transporting ATPase subunit delta
MTTSSLNLHLIDKYSNAFMLISKNNFSSDILLQYIDLLMNSFEKYTIIIDIFASPIISNSGKIDLLNKFFKELDIPAVIEYFFIEIIKNKRADNIVQILNITKKNLLLLKGIKFIDITSSYCLEQSEKEKIKQVISDELGHEIIINYIVDKSIFGGLVISDGIKTYDDSIKNKLSLLISESAVKFQYI